MKKFTIILILATMLLSGCSFLNEVNDTLDYVGVTTEHIERLNTFAEEAPQLVEDALSNPELVTELEAKLTTLKTEIEGFIALSNIPTIAEDIHQELITKNELLLEEINKVLENGHIALDKLENSQIFTTISDVTSLMNRIENLTQ